MFSGIVEEAAQVVALNADQGNLHITMKCSFVNELKIDQSVAHNGVCLTVVNLTDETYTVTAIQETLDRSNLGLLKVGDLVNLERSMMTDISFRGMWIRRLFVRMYAKRTEAGIIHLNILSTRRWRSRDI